MQEEKRFFPWYLIYCDVFISPPLFFIYDFPLLFQIFDLQLKVDQQNEISELMYAKYVTGKKERFQITKSPQGNLKIIASDVETNRNPAENDSNAGLQDERTDFEGKFNYFVFIH